MSNPFRRAAWRPAYVEEDGAQRAAYWSMMGHHVIVTGSGAIGFLFDPSPSVARVFGGEAATYLWSSAFVIFGVLGVLARTVRAVASEIWILGGLILTRLLFVAFIVAGLFVDRPPAAGGPVNYGALQTASIILAGSMAMTAITFWMYAWLKTGRVSPVDRIRQNEELQRVVSKIIDGGLDQDGTH